MTDPVDRDLTPSDVLAAVRSFPRRFRDLLTADDDEDVDALATTPGDDGRTALDHVGEATDALGGLASGLGGPGVPITQGADVETALAGLDRAAQAAAGAVDATPNESWNQPAGDATRLEVAQESVARAAGRLRDTRDLLERLR